MRDTSRFVPEKAEALADMQGRNLLASLKELTDTLHMITNTLHLSFPEAWRCNKEGDTEINVIVLQGKRENRDVLNVYFTRPHNPDYFEDEKEPDVTFYIDEMHMRSTGQVRAMLLQAFYKLTFDYIVLEGYF